MTFKPQLNTAPNENKIRKHSLFINREDQEYTLKQTFTNAVIVVSTALFIAGITYTVGKQLQK